MWDDMVKLSSLELYDTGRFVHFTEVMWFRRTWVLMVLLTVLQRGQYSFNNNNLYGCHEDDQAVMQQCDEGTKCIT